MRMIDSLLPKEREIILGAMAGDSWIATTTKGYNYLWFSHSSKQKEYLEWKFDNLVTVRGNKITEYHLKNSPYSRFQFACKHDERLTNDLKRLVYDGKKRIITRHFLNMLTPLSIAVWWMDDGNLAICNSNRWGKLSTNRYSEHENNLISKYFKNVWGIDTSVKIEKGKYFFIRFNATGLKKLINLIYPYVEEVPSMLYKIDMKYQNGKTYPYDT